MERNDFPDIDHIDPFDWGWDPPELDELEREEMLARMGDEDKKKEVTETENPDDLPF